MLLGAIADDYTGATDLCSVLVRGGMRTVQTIGVPEHAYDTDAVVVALKTRTAPVDDAVAQSLDALRALRALGAQRFYLKICSTFDSTPEGNIGPVADALLDEVGADFAVVTPAYPANGRTVYKGYLFVGDVLRSESSMRDHPLTPMRDANLVRVLQQQTSRPVGRLGDAGVTYAIADATIDDDLIALGEAYRDLPLLVGGAGLALGLPRAHGFDGAAAPVAHPEGPAIIIVGSLSEATRTQVERFRAGHRGDTELVQSGKSTPAEVEADLAAAARDAVANGVRRVIVAGGETSGAVVQALGIRALAVGEEIAPGVPWMSTLDHDPPLALALKSGNFGGPDFFLEALA